MTTREDALARRLARRERLTLERDKHGRLRVRYKATLGENVLLYGLVSAIVASFLGMIVVFTWAIAVQYGAWTIPVTLLVLTGLFIAAVGLVP